MRTHLTKTILILTLTALPALATPPGLDKKPGDMPPGQYKKQVEQHHDRYERIDASRYRLPTAPAGKVYAINGNDIILIDQDTQAIIQIMGAVSTLLN